MSPKWVRRLSLLSVIVNVAIIVTGGAVRLTGSGLGCPSWPNCAPGTFQNTPAMGMHGAIEWGNRLFGVIVGIVAVATFLAAWWRKPRRRSLLWLTTAVAIGVAGQGAIGAFTVNTGLAPWLVSIHFGVSVVLLTAAFAAWWRSGEPDGPARPIVAAPARRLWWLLAAVALAAIGVGTVVTGSGPHAGDPDAARLGFDPAVTAQLHADLVYALLGLTAGLLFLLYAVKARPSVIRAAWWLLGVELAQGAIGMVQYFTGLPELLVGAHLLGSAVLWLAVLAVGFALRDRVPRVADETATVRPRAASDEPSTGDAESTDATDATGSAGDAIAVTEAGRA